MNADAFVPYLFLFTGEHRQFFCKTRVSSILHWMRFSRLSGKAQVRWSMCLHPRGPHGPPAGGGSARPPPPWPPAPPPSAPAPAAPAVCGRAFSVSGEVCVCGGGKHGIRKQNVLMTPKYLKTTPIQKHARFQLLPFSMQRMQMLLATSTTKYNPDRISRIVENKMQKPSGNKCRSSKMGMKILLRFYPLTPTVRSSLYVTSQK